MMKSAVIALLERKSGERGLTGKVAALIADRPAAFPELMFGLWHVDGYVRERAADAIAGITRERPQYLQPFKAELLGVMAEARPASVRWHLAAMAARLKLNKKERRQAMEILRRYLGDRSTVVKASALDSLADLADQDAGIRAEIVQILETFTRTAQPPMKMWGQKKLDRLTK